MLRRIGNDTSTKNDNSNSGSSSNIRSSKHGGEDEISSVVDALKGALRHTESKQERANIQLAIAMHKHLAEERAEYKRERLALEAKWQHARDSHQLCIEQPFLNRRQDNSSSSSSSQKSAAAAAELSKIVLRGAEARVIQASEALRLLDARFDRARERREAELRLAFVACEPVLRRYRSKCGEYRYNGHSVDDGGSCSANRMKPSPSLPLLLPLPLPVSSHSVSKAARSIPRLPLPPPPPPPIPPKPGILSSRFPPVSGKSSLPDLPPPPLPPPPLPPPPPLKPKSLSQSQPLLQSASAAASASAGSNSKLPFTITMNSSNDALRTQLRIQQRIPSKYLPGFPVMQPELTSAAAAEAVVAQAPQSLESKVKGLVVGQLRVCVCGALMAAIPGVASVDIVEGMAGFGADAYLV
ncbi:hypothetical protein GGH99_000908, partial [Coemansia sp. RSA 1285]